jgi:multicomponent K+:H+ antiporter subunit E
MTRRLLPHPLLSLAVILVWLLLVNSLSPGQILLGVVAYDILTANIAVARLILTPNRPVRPAFVIMPLALRTDLAISLLANTICLTPGTVSARLSADQRELLIHALDVDDPQTLVETIRERYETPLREIFEPC